MIRCNATAQPETLVYRKRTTHNAPCASKTEVNDRVRLLTKPVDLALLPDPVRVRHRSSYVQRDELPEERPDQDPVGNEHEIQVTLLVKRCFGG